MADPILDLAAMQAATDPSTRNSPMDDFLSWVTGLRNQPAALSSMPGLPPPAPLQMAVDDAGMFGRDWSTAAPPRDTRDTGLDFGPPNLPFAAVPLPKNDRRVSRDAAVSSLAAGDVTTERIGGWRPSGQWSPQFRAVAEEDPEQAMAMVLQARGFRDDGELVRLGPALLTAYRLVGAYNAAPSGRANYELDAGKIHRDNSDLLSFMDSYITAYTSTDAQDRDRFKQLRGMLRAQVQAGLRNPTSEVGAETRALLDRAAASGEPNAEYALWSQLIAPSLMAAGTQGQRMSTARRQFDQLVKQHRRLKLEVAARGGDPNISFIDYLSEKGYDPFEVAP